MGTLCHLHSGCQGEVFRDLFDSLPHLTKRRVSLQVPAVLYRAENTLNALSGCHTQGHGCREKTARPIRAYAANGTCEARRRQGRYVKGFVGKRKSSSRRPSVTTSGHIYTRLSKGSPTQIKTEDKKGVQKRPHLYRCSLTYFSQAVPFTSCFTPSHTRSKAWRREKKKNMQ